MKKLLALMLAAALALSVAACGSKTPTKEDLRKDAIEVDLKE